MFSFRGIALAFALVPAVVCADESAPAPQSGELTLPQYQVLPCKGACARSTGAVPIEHGRANFSSSVSWGEHGYVEALVTIEYTVGIDGNVRDARVVRLLGPKELADQALVTVRHWTFKPATLEGKPVEQGLETNYYFMDQRYSPGARPKIRDAYRNAMTLVGEGKLDAALRVLQTCQSEAYLNFYERTGIAYAMATLYEREKNDREALKWITVALTTGYVHSDQAVVISALRLGFVIAARNNELGWALVFASGLHHFHEYPSNKFHGDNPPEPDAPLEPIDKAVNDIQAAIAGPLPIVAAGSIPSSAEGGLSYRHILVRRAFAFNAIQGSLSRLRLTCNQQVIESAVSTTAEWHIPKSWSNCVVVVDGSPGTTFNFVELN